MENIRNKVVVIAGASSGLGEALARRLVDEGAKVVLGARREERLKRLINELDLPENSSIKTDVTHPEQVQALVERAIKLYGRIDVMVNNAGLMPHSLLEKCKIDDWNAMIDVNLKGTLRHCRRTSLYAKTKIRTFYQYFLSCWASSTTWWRGLFCYKNSGQSDQRRVKARSKAVQYSDYDYFPRSSAK